MAADFNGDGIPDLAASNSGNNGAAVLLGNGLGAFTAAAGGTFPVGTAPVSIAAGDFNGDGKSDLVVANADDNTVTVLLGGASSTSSLLLAGSATITVGQSVSLTVIISYPYPASGFEAPTGTVTFLDGTTVLGTVAPQPSSPFPFVYPGVASATFAATGLSLGGHTITATYSGDARTNGSSSSDSFTIQVNPFALITQSITFGPLYDVPLAQGLVVLNARASSALTVTFVSTTPGVCTLIGATYLTLVSLGNCSITASQAGNATYAAATPLVESFNVILAPQTIAFTTPGVVTIPSAPFTLTATASSGLPVSFTSTTVAICTVSGSTVTPLAAGTCSITASQADNALDAAASNLIRNITIVTAGTQIITFDPIPDQMLGVSPFVISAEASSLLAVNFASTTPAVCKTASVLVMLLTTGTCSITASQPGNGTYSAATPVSQSFSVSLSKPSGTLTASTGSPFAFGFAAYTAVGDFNEDGIQDLVVTNTDDGSLKILLGNGSGGVTAVAGEILEGAISPPVVGDFNGDGYQDVAVASALDSVGVLLGNAIGGFTAPAGNPFPTGSSPYSLVVGDFNGDGIQDLATANLYDNNITVLLGNGSGGCTATTYCPTQPVTREEMAVFIMRGAFNLFLPPGTPLLTQISPSTLSPGVSGTFTITGTNTNLQGTTQLSPIPGVTVGTITVISPTTMTVQLTASPSAVTQPYSILAITGSEQDVLPNGLVIQ